MAIRKDANTLNSNERRELVDAILQLKADGVYDQFVLRHANAIMSAIHNCPAFLPWHRRFLWDFEKELQRVSGNPDLGVPYWNWPSGDAGASMWDDNLLGGDGDTNGIVRSGPFRAGQWEVVNSSGNFTGPLTRGFGRSVGGAALPTNNEIQTLLQHTPYDSAPWRRTSQPGFRAQLEGGAGSVGFHNFGHGWVGGSMLVMTSPNDPIFFFHHCMVDKLWHEWQQLFPSQSYLPVTGGNFGQNLSDIMDSTPVASIGRRPNDVLSSATLGIEYDDAPVVQPPQQFATLNVDASATNGRIGVAGELDIYVFDVNNFGEYKIETFGSSDTFITLFGPNDPLDQIAFNDDGGTNLNSNITLNLSAGTYFVAVRLFSPTRTGDYSIQVSATSQASSIPEIIVDAPAISAAISARNESDVYRFNVVRRANHTIETTGVTDTYLSLFGPDDETLLVEENDDSGQRFNSRIRRILTAGEYYARVRHYSPDGTGAYSISVEKR